MPKTATGKIQRRLVAKAMIESRPTVSEESSPSASISKEKEAAKRSSGVMTFLIRSVGQCLGGRSPLGK